MSWVAISCTTLSLASRKAFAQESRLAPASTPSWQVDLRSFGYTGYEPRNYEWPGPNTIPPIFFSSPNAVVVGFVTRHMVSGLQRRDQEHLEEPYVLHIISLDTHNGAALSVLSWPVPDPRSRVVPTDHHNFLVTTPDQMTLYSPSFKRLAELGLRTLESSGSFWVAHLSPTAKSILIEYSASDPLPHHFLWINADSLRPMASWTGTSQLVATSAAISDDSVAIYMGWFPSPVRTQVLIRRLDGATRVFCDAQRSCGTPMILNQSTLVLWMARDELKVVGLDGKELFDEKFPYQTQWIGKSFAPSASGQEFAVPVYRPKGGWPGLDISPKMTLDKVVVYGIDLRGPVYTLDEKKLKITYATLSGMALSPDGSQLALLADGILRDYRIPYSGSKTDHDDYR